MEQTDTDYKTRNMARQKEIEIVKSALSLIVEAADRLE
jgi:hypothetical protein